MKALLINPWIYDFTAFDLWSKPLGLLYIGSFLHNYGIEVSLIDCLYGSREGKPKRFGTGKYQREIIEKPTVLQKVPRNYSRYGISEKQFIDSLKANSDADIVLVTTIMTYWYPAVRRCVELVRKYLPAKPVVLGGIYASILPDHAQKTIAPDYLITGPGEIKIAELIDALFGTEIAEPARQLHFDDYPSPTFWLYPKLDYLAIMTTRGCPYNCCFCAQKQISMPFVKRKPENVIREFSENYRKFGTRDFAFYDDALFADKDRHIKPILEGIIELGLPLRLHTPNGLFAGMIDDELASLMFRANFRTIRLSFETSNEERRVDMGSKITNDDMIKAVENLRNAGYKSGEIEAYILFGLPDQSDGEVIESLHFVHKLGVKARLASFSPIHGTDYFKQAVEQGLIETDTDPLLTNKSIFPLSKDTDKFEKYKKIRNYGKKLNSQLPNRP